MRHLPLAPFFLILAALLYLGAQAVPFVASVRDAGGIAAYFLSAPPSQANNHAGPQGQAGRGLARGSSWKPLSMRVRGAHDFPSHRFSGFVSFHYVKIEA